ncbi:MAG TPA: sulfatase-like hydrolase/transferase [Candidatus Hydrogenedentes bacterium]|nr:sulfatase-like hydrolase/transferase [Candidatus Hydrogenedentota bacterium]
MVKIDRTYAAKTINRRSFLGCAGISAAAACLPLGCTTHSPQKIKRPPNILFLFSDDQRFDTIHALGNPIIQTPALDVLTKHGAVFSNTYIMGSTVPAVCMPSRAMLLTGRHVFNFQHPENIPDEMPLWPEIFRNHGYHTFGIGKWHNGARSFNRAFENGGKIFFGGMNDHYAVPVHDYDPSGAYAKQTQHVEKKFSSELFADEAIRFLHEYHQDTPFLLYVSFTAPHDPRMAPEPFQKLYPKDQIPLPKNFMPRHPFDNGEMEIRDEKLAPWPRTPEIVKEHIADYYAMISHLDAQIGRIMDALKETGHADDTIIVYTSDNGLAVGQHGLLGKQSLYEHSLKVPLIITGPGVPRGRHVDAACYLMDLFPTLCDLAGIPCPADLDGKSLAPVLSGASQAHREDLFFAYRNVQRGVRTGNLKLIEYCVANQRQTQLFNLHDDPCEMNNLATETAHKQDVVRLRNLLHAWHEKLNDPDSSSFI